MELQGFGNGSDGPLTISSNTIESPIDSSCSGSATSLSLSATNALFANNQLIMIHQTRGSGAGSWELNFIDSYVAGTITCQFPLVNTYTDSGASQAQVRVVPQYSKVTIQSGATYSAKAWDQNVGGILAFLVAGEFVNEGTVSANSAGFYGGSGVTGNYGYQGEGTGGAGTMSDAANGNGGGGGAKGASGDAGGGGGGHAASGSAGGAIGSAHGGTGGGESGNADLGISMTFGGGGGGGLQDSDPGAAGAGGRGAGIIMIWAESIITSVGSIQSNGANGSSGVGGGGGGAGGSIYLVAIAMNIGTNRLYTSAGSGAGDPSGGNGAVGRVRLEACSLTGSTIYGSVSQVIGGHDFCQTMIHVYG